MRGPGHQRGIGLSLECCQDIGLLRGRAFFHVTVASHRATSTIFGLRLLVLPVDLFLLPVPSRMSTSVRKDL